jgi:sterol desaturase/sphingolipid hydroxylase (fatty acid hydroxylase superfamily)
MLLWMDRKDPAYLWMSLVCVATIFSNGVLLIVSFSTWISQMPFVLLADVISLPLRISLWVIFWGVLVQDCPDDWVHRIVWDLRFCS